MISEELIKKITEQTLLKLRQPVDFAIGRIAAIEEEDAEVAKGVLQDLTGKVVQNYQTAQNGYEYQTEIRKGF